jgi:dihydroflavonol-4-reductase
LQAFVTGGTGFIGSHLVERLVRDNQHVRVLARKTSDTEKLSGLGVEVVKGDVIDPASLKGKMKDCDTLYHVANVYDWWLPNKSTFYKVNVDGTRNVLNEAMGSGVEKIVYTSSVAAIGEKKGEIASEDTSHSKYFPSDYNRSKYLGLEEAMKMRAENGLPVVAVMPSAVIGPGDFKATGRTILDFLNKKLPGVFYTGTIFGYVDVNDVVRGHVLAAEKGRVGEKYVLSSENLALGDLFEILSDISGVPVPKRNIAPLMAKTFSYFMEFNSLFTRKPPRFPLGLVRSMEHGLAVDNSKARKELGMEFTPMKETLARTIEWYRENGYAPKPEALR